MKTRFTSVIALLFPALLFAQGKLEINQPVPMGEDTIQGTLASAFPLGNKFFNEQPLVIIIPGSGPTDRDGNSAILPGPNNSFKQLSDSLLKKEIATYRYDKLGVGESKITRSESEFTFEDNVEMVKTIFGKMEELGFDEIYLLGHSEGSLVGILAAQDLDVDGLISIAGSSRNLYNLLTEQLKNNLPEQMQESTLRKLDSVKQGYTVTDYNPMLASLLRESVQPYLHSSFQYTPTEELKEVEKPVLIIQGGNDMQVKKGDGEALKEAKPSAEYIFYPEMNHVLKIIDGSQEQNVGSYSDPDFPLNPELAGDIEEWIEENQ